jgi:long-chain acyl-CoA synthetase
MPIYVGARITIIESVRPFKKVLKAIITNRVTIFIGVPPIYNILKDFKIPRILSLRIFRFLNPLRLCISGADKLPTETLNKFESKFKIPLLEGYGLTEASPVVAVNPLIGQHKSGSVGPPLANIKIKVLDESENELPPDQVGELLVKGPNVMKGYLNLADETSLAIKEGWLYTGDMARVDKDGYIYLVDRKKDIIIVRGLNVYPKEIEDVLYQHPRVAEAGVIGIKDKYKGEVPKAFVVLEKGGKVTEQEIIHFCRQRLAPYKIPRSIEFRTSLPKTPTGKILKKELK